MMSLLIPPPSFRKKILLLLPPITTIVTLAGCGKIEIPDVEIPWAYKIDIPQGNVVTQEMLDKLRPGMGKRKVRFVLGTPLIVSAFSEDRWDYVYSFQAGSGEREQRRFSLFFEDDRLHYIEGDIMPGQPAGNDSRSGSDPKQDHRPSMGRYE